MSLLKKADLARKTMHAKAVTKTGLAGVTALGAVGDLALNAALALATKSPLAIAGTALAAGVLAKKLFW